MKMLLLAAAALAASTAPAFAQTGDDAVAEALACQAVRGTKARLRCFDAAMPALGSAYPAAVQLAADRAEAARLAAAEVEKEEFGLSPTQRETTLAEAPTAQDYERGAFGENDIKRRTGDADDDEVESVDGVAIEVGKNNRGKIFVILDNGQVWRQVSGDSSSPYYPKKVDGLPVTIKKGALGSYFVKIGKSKDAFKAERIK